MVGPHQVRAGADLLVAFFRSGAGNRGTGHCVQAAANAGIPTRRIWQEHEVRHT